MATEDTVNNKSHTDAHTCDPCKFRGEESRGLIYCKTCQETLCEDCADVHKSSKATRTHFLLNIKDKVVNSKTGTALDILQECSQHTGKKLEFYCTDHNHLLCSTCVLLNHKTKCKSVTDVAIAGEALLTSTFLGKVRTVLQSATLKLKRDAERVELQKKTSEKAEIDIRAGLIETREKLLHLFNKVENEILSRIRTERIHENEQLDMLQDRINEILDRLSDDSLVLERVIENGSGSDILRCILLLGYDLEKCIANIDVKKSTVEICTHSFRVSTALQLLLNGSIPLVEESQQQFRFSISDFPQIQISFDEFRDIVSSRGLRETEESGITDNNADTINCDQCLKEFNQAHQSASTVRLTLQEECIATQDSRNKHYSNEPLFTGLSAACPTPHTTYSFTAPTVHPFTCPLILPFRPPQPVQNIRPRYVSEMQLCNPPLGNFFLQFPPPAQPSYAHHSYSGSSLYMTFNRETILQDESQVLTPKERQEYPTVHANMKIRTEEEPDEATEVPSELPRLKQNDTYKHKIPSAEYVASSNDADKEEQEMQMQRQEKSFFQKPNTPTRSQRRRRDRKRANIDELPSLTKDTCNKKNDKGSIGLEQSNEIKADHLKNKRTNTGDDLPETVQSLESLKGDIKCNSDQISNVEEDAEVGTAIECSETCAEDSLGKQYGDLEKAKQAKNNDMNAKENCDITDEMRSKLLHVETEYHLTRSYVNNLDKRECRDFIEPLNKQSLYLSESIKQTMHADSKNNDYDLTESFESSEELLERDETNLPEVMNTKSNTSQSVLTKEIESKEKSAENEISHLPEPNEENLQTEISTDASVHNKYFEFGSVVVEKEMMTLNEPADQIQQTESNGNCTVFSKCCIHANEPEALPETFEISKTVQKQKPNTKVDIKFGNEPEITSIKPTHTPELFENAASTQKGDFTESLKGDLLHVKEKNVSGQNNITSSETNRCSALTEESIKTELHITHESIDIADRDIVIKEKASESDKRILSHIEGQQRSENADSHIKCTEVDENDLIQFDMKRKTMFQIPKHKNKCAEMMSILVLPDDRIIVCDYDNCRLIMFDKIFNPQDTFKLSEEVACVVALKVQHIAICHENKRKISLLKYSPKLKFDSCFNTQYHAKCVCSVGDTNMLVSMLDGTGKWHLHILSNKGKLIQKLQLGRIILDGYSLAIIFSADFKFGYRIIQCCQKSDAVYCFEKDGRQLFKFNTESPNSVVVHDFGYIFLLDNFDHIQVLSHSGQQLYKAQLCSDVTSIAVTQQMNKLLLTRYKDSKITVFTVASKERQATEVTEKENCHE